MKVVFFDLVYDAQEVWMDEGFAQIQKLDVSWRVGEVLSFTSLCISYSW